MMEYDGDAHIPPHFLVQPPAIDHVISEYLCAEKVKTFAVSETRSSAMLLTSGTATVPVISMNHWKICGDTFRQD